MRGQVLCLLFLFACVCFAVIEDRTPVDLFFAPDARAVSATNGGSDFLYTSGGFIAGAERDEYIVLTSGSATSIVSDNTYKINFNGVGKAFLQYDGFDFTTDGLRTRGLSNYNFGAGNATTFHLVLATSGDVTIRFKVYDGDESCSFEQVLASTGGNFVSFYADYDQFIGNVNLFYHAGALELIFFGDDGDQVTVSRFYTATDSEIFSSFTSYNTNSITTAVQSFTIIPDGTRQSVSSGRLLSPIGATNSDSNTLSACVSLVVFVIVLVLC